MLQHVLKRSEHRNPAINIVTNNLAIHNLQTILSAIVNNNNLSTYECTLKRNLNGLFPNDDIMLKEIKLHVLKKPEPLPEHLNPVSIIPFTRVNS